MHGGESLSDFGDSSTGAHSQAQGRRCAVEDLAGGRCLELASRSTDLSKAVI